MLCFFHLVVSLMMSIVFADRSGFFFFSRVALFHLGVLESGYLLFSVGRRRSLVVLLLVRLSEVVPCRCVFFFRVLLLVGFLDFLRVWFSPVFFLAYF